MKNFSLVGNPNVGKTSLFNRVTRSFERVGNWHGVTVEKKEKTIEYEGERIRITDLPGLYSLTVYSFEEEISRDTVLSNDSDLVICITEVNNLSRNLYLALQLMELSVPVVVVINMVDELKRQGKVLDIKNLENALKVPIVAMSAKYSSDCKRLIKTCLNHIKNNNNSKTDLKYLKRLPLEKISSIISENAKKARLDIKYASIKVLERDKYIIDRLKLTDNQKNKIAEIGDFQDYVAKLRYAFIDEITAGVITNEKQIKNKEKDRFKISGLDKILLNKYLALPVFLLVMCAIFFVTFGSIGGLLSDLFYKGLESFVYRPFTNLLQKTDIYDWLKSLLIEGIIKGAGGILVFLPQILLLFLFLAFLEDSGYISRVAFMTDGIFRKIGLSGRSVFTMLMGFGCSATAILTARGLEDDMMRKKTILLTPFMSCSAKLPVYSAIVASFFNSSPLIIFALYILGIAVAIFFATLFQKIKPLRSGKLSFIMEIPPFRLPSFERVFQLIFHNIKLFLIRVATIVFALNAILWVLSNFSLTSGFLIEDNNGISIMETFSNLISPIFKPLGFGNWRAVTALLSGLIAKEAVISTISSIGGEALVLGASPLTAFCFLVFVLLYVPCMASLATVKKEIGTKWTIFSFVFQFFTAYTLSLLVRLIGLLFINFKILAFSLISVIIIALIATFFIAKMIKYKGRCVNCNFSCRECKNEA